LNFGLQDLKLVTYQSPTVIKLYETPITNIEPPSLRLQHLDVNNISLADVDTGDLKLIYTMCQIKTQTYSKIKT